MLRARALDQNITVAALATGDTARALEAQHAIADDLPEGSTDRRQALAKTLRLGIEWGGRGGEGVAGGVREGIPLRSPTG